MKIAMLSPIAWRTPPRHYGPWELITSQLTEGLLERGIDVTLFATGDSITRGKLHAICPTGYEEDRTMDPKVWECLHISEVFEHASEFDLIHNQYDFLPLTYSKLVNTPVLITIHGFSSNKIYPVYEKYNDHVFYVSISYANRLKTLDYIANIYHGIDLTHFTFSSQPGNYLLFFGRIHPDKGTRQAIQIAREVGMKLIIAGIIQDKEYFDEQVKPFIEENKVEFVENVEPVLRNKLMAEAYALLHPINFEEPFGLSVVEAMACGTPVIAFKRGSMPEIIRHKKTGFLVKDVLGAVEAVKQVDSIDRGACRNEVETRFNVDRMVEEYLELYKKILNNPEKALQRGKIDD